MVKKKLPIPTRKCGVCNVDFQPRRPSQIICTMECFRAFRAKQREIEYVRRSQSPIPDGTRQCASCGGSFVGDPLFVTCTNCRRPCKVTTGGCQRWGGADHSVGPVKKISVETMR